MAICGTMGGKQHQEYNHKAWTLNLLCFVHLLTVLKYLSFYRY